LRSQRLIDAAVPLWSLAELAASPPVAWIRAAPRPNVADVVSQGVMTTNAGELLASPVRYGPPAAPIRVGVLDVGFRGYQDLLGSELPATVEARSFGYGGIDAPDLDPVDAVHGAACAEVIHDMAPDAELVFANVDSIASHADAVDWLIEQNVDIISNSLGWWNYGPGDGRGPLNDDVRRALDAGIDWVVAAGNQAQLHWEGPFTDLNGDGFHDFSPTDSSNSVFMNAGDTMFAFLSWDDWFESDQDYDLYVYFEDGSLVAVAGGPQTGVEWPLEATGFATDGRMKPDIAGPDGIDTASYHALGGQFFGTSSGAPHVAGAMALMRSRFTIFSPAQINNILFSRAVDAGAPGKDNVYGAGRLDLRGR